MAKSKAQKISEVEVLTSELKNAKSAMVITMTGLKVKDNWAFRSALRKEGVKLEVAKKTIFKIVLDKLNINMPVDDLQGTVALVVDGQEEARPAKIVATFKKDHPLVDLQRGVIKIGDAWQTFDKNGVLELSKLPSKQELLSKLLFLLNYPTSGLVRTLAGVPQKFVRSLQAIHDKKAGSN